jgi:hypothetical protein
LTRLKGLSLLNDSILLRRIFIGFWLHCRGLKWTGRVAVGDFVRLGDLSRWVIDYVRVFVNKSS